MLLFIMHPHFLRLLWWNRKDLDPSVDLAFIDFGLASSSGTAEDKVKQTNAHHCTSVYLYAPTHLVAGFGGGDL